MSQFIILKEQYTWIHVEKPTINCEESATEGFQLNATTLCSCLLNSSSHLRNVSVSTYMHINLAKPLAQVANIISLKYTDLTILGTSSLRWTFKYNHLNKFTKKRPRWRGANCMSKKADFSTARYLQVILVALLFLWSEKKQKNSRRKLRLLSEHCAPLNPSNRRIFHIHY